MSALRASLIEAQIREQKLKDEQDFYRIHLSVDAQEDIDKLLRFAKECHSQQPLRKLIWSEYFLKPFGEMAGRILGKDKISGIYKITNIKDGKIYIGQSTDVKTRWSNHIKAALKIDSIAHSRVHDAMGEEGIWNFTFELLEQCPKEKLNEREKYYIEFYQSNTYGYNKTAGGA
nr:MAG TPA: intron associated endonuclease [Caudoviricetes sp.]